MHFLDGSILKNPSANARDTASVPPGRSPGEGNGNLVHCSCLGDPMDIGAWWATDRGVDLATKQQQHLK